MFWVEDVHLAPLCIRFVVFEVCRVWRALAQVVLSHGVGYAVQVNVTPV